MCVIGIFGLLFGVSHDINHSKQADKKLKETKAQEWVIRVVNKNGSIQNYSRINSRG